MPTRIYRPNADGSILGWIPLGGGAHWDKVDDVIPDEDATYIYRGPYVPNGIPADLVECEDPGGEIPFGFGIDWVRVYHRGKSIGAGSRGQVTPIIYDPSWVWGINYGAAAWYLWLGYETFNWTWMLNPETGVGWRRAELASLQVGVAKWTAPGTVRCTQLYMEVSFSLVAPLGGLSDDF